jgi:hypothetical protein
MIERENDRERECKAMKRHSTPKTDRTREGARDLRD